MSDAGFGGVMRQERMIILFGFLLSLGMLQSGCEEVALVGRPTVGPGGGIEDIEFVANVEGLDTQHQEIYLQTQEGRTRVVEYHGDTRVIIGGREYPVRDLRVGDRVAMEIRKDSRGQDYADLIRVRKRSSELSRADRNEITTLEGRVEQINGQRGFFEVHSRFGNVVRVMLPYNPPRQLKEKFYRLRSGDYVRVEGERLGDDRLMLRAFF
jgi:hypothetical protein